MNKILIVSFVVLLLSCKAVLPPSDSDKPISENTKTIVGSWFYVNNLIKITKENLVFTYYKDFDSSSGICPIKFMDEEKIIVDCPKYNMNNHELYYVKEIDKLMIKDVNTEVYIDRVPEVDISELVGRWIEVNEYSSNETTIILTTQFETYYDYETYEINHQNKTYTYLLEKINTEFLHGNTFVDTYDNEIFSYQLVSKKQDEVVWVGEDGYMWKAKKYTGNVHEDYIDSDYKLIENNN